MADADSKKRKTATGAGGGGKAHKTGGADADGDRERREKVRSRSLLIDTLAHPLPLPLSHLFSLQRLFLLDNLSPHLPLWGPPLWGVGPKEGRGAAPRGRRARDLDASARLTDFLRVAGGNFPGQCFGGREQGDEISCEDAGDRDRGGPRTPILPAPPPSACHACLLIGCRRHPSPPHLPSADHDMAG